MEQSKTYAVITSYSIHYTKLYEVQRYVQDGRRDSRRNSGARLGKGSRVPDPQSDAPGPRRTLPDGTGAPRSGRDRDPHVAGTAEGGRHSR